APVQAVRPVRDAQAGGAGRAGRAGVPCHPRMGLLGLDPDGAGPRRRRVLPPPPPARRHPCPHAAAGLALPPTEGRRMNIKLSTPAAVAAALAGMLAATPALAADYVQAPGSTL